MKYNNRCHNLRDFFTGEPGSWTTRWHRFIKKSLFVHGLRKVKGKCKGLDTCYSATYMSHTDS